MPEAPLRRSAASLPEGARLGDGEVLECVSRGRTGYLYRVRSTTEPKVWAVREYLPPGLATRAGRCVVPVEEAHDAFQAGLRSFLRDARRLAAQDHGALLKVHDVWLADGTAYMATPWYSGQTLEQMLLAPAAPLAQEQLGHWLRALADALAPFHRGGAVHGQIHPEHVLITTADRPVLLGWRSAAAALGGEHLQASAYTAPEWANAGQPGVGKVGPWTDVYSFAALMHLAVTGCAPPEPARRAGPCDALAFAARVRGPYSAGFVQGIDAGLALQPEERPQSLPLFLALLGLPERRARQRFPGQTQRVHASESPPVPSFDDTAPSVLPMVGVGWNLPPSGDTALNTVVNASIDTAVDAAVDGSVDDALRHTKRARTAAATATAAAAAAAATAAAAAPVTPSQRAAPGYADASIEHVDTHLLPRRERGEAAASGEFSDSSVMRLWPTDFGGMDAQPGEAGGGPAALPSWFARLPEATMRGGRSLVGSFARSLARWAGTRGS